MYNYIYGKKSCLSKMIGKNIRVMVTLLSIVMLTMGVGNADAGFFFAAGTILSAVTQIIVALVLDD